MQNWIIDLKFRRPNSQFILVGDFNSRKPPMKDLYHLNDKNIPTFKWYRGDKKGQSTLDWFVSVNSLKAEIEYM